jgi:hypothetical protein
LLLFLPFLFCSIGEWGANEPSKLIELVVKRKRAKDGRNRIKRENTTRKNTNEKRKGRK